MSKTTIGHFEDTTNKKSEGINKKYNIFFRRGYGYRNSTFEIGNHTFGIFFRFGLNNCYVWVSRYELDKKSMCEIKYPREDNDVEKILNEIFKPIGLKLIDLKYKSRKELDKIGFMELL